MGYSTDFEGTLRFTCEPTVPMLATLKGYFGEDSSKVLGVARDKGGYIDLELTADMMGIKWDGSEKTYHLAETIDALIFRMRETFPDFGLEGELLAQGEDIDDRWRLLVSGSAVAVEKIQPTGTKVSCPKCDHKFRVG